jgi:Concanavalin A-like lectin/glucanases superfamily
LSVLFDASTDSLLRSTGLPLIDAATAMAWVWLASNIGSYTTAAYFGANAGAGYYLGTGATGTTFYISSDAAEFTGSEMTIQTWSHLAMTIAGTGAGQFLGYLNGGSIITGNGSAGPAAARLQIGNAPGPIPWPGRIANVQIYNVALSQADIQQAMQQYVPQRWADLNAWYPLLNAANVSDYTTAATVWTVGGTLTDADGPPIPWDRRPWGHAAWQAAAVVKKAPPPRRQAWRILRRAA